MPSITEQSVTWERERAELDAVRQSHLFSRSPALSHLLTYLCEKTFSGETDQIKEYSIALDVFDRRETFDQDTDSIVRVQANRLRKRLSEYYAEEGASHPLRIHIPVGQYIPLFVRQKETNAASCARQPALQGEARYSSAMLSWLFGGAVVLLIVLATVWSNRKPEPRSVPSVPASQAATEASVGLPVGDEVRILSGATRKYVDHAGKVWSPDAFFTGGEAISSVAQHIWRTQDPIIYRNSRQGNFLYDIPLKPGIYELHLHFAESFYGPESAEGGGEGSRLFSVSVNGAPLLQKFDAFADSGEGRTADVKIFSGISPAPDGELHLAFSSEKGASAMVSAIEILPGIRGNIRPTRIVARDVPYYSNDSRWWSPDTYFKGGQLSSSPRPLDGTDDPEFYESERWGHFSYAIPATAGRYTVTLYFAERPVQEKETSTPAESGVNERVFNVFCNGKTIVSNLNLAGGNRPLTRTLKGLEPNAQDKLLLEFVPVKGYAMVTAIEVVPE